MSFSSPHQMRRSDRQMAPEKALEVLDSALFAVLAVIDTTAETFAIPYSIPLSFAFDRKNMALYFHKARGAGRLLHCMAASQTPLPAHCSIVTDVHTLPQKFSTEYASAMIEGELDLLDTDAEKLEALLMLTAKYSPGFEKEALAYATKSVGKVDIVRLRISRLTGKSRPVRQ